MGMLIVFECIAVQHPFNSNLIEPERWVLLERYIERVKEPGDSLTSIVSNCIRQLLEGNAFRQGEWAAACAHERCQVRATAELLANVMSQGTDIRALAALDREGEARRKPVDDFESIDGDGAWLEGDVFTSTR